LPALLKKTDAPTWRFDDLSRSLNDDVCVIDHHESVASKMDITDLRDSSS
jgi:hypothetical protein